jgi:hypothetical protein
VVLVQFKYEDARCSIDEPLQIMMPLCVASEYIEINDEDGAPNVKSKLFKQLRCNLCIKQYESDLR